jgi:hypothetical protein
MKVKSAQVTRPVGLAGTKFSAATSITPTKYNGLKLTLIPEGLIVEIEGKMGLVPLSNLDFVVLEPEDGRLKPTA